MPPADVDTNPTVSFHDLYRSHRLAMTRLSTTIVGSVAVAEELVQDSFVRLHQRWEGIDNPGGYLRVAVTNASIAYLRRAKLERERTPMSPRVAIGDPEIDETWAAVCELPPRQRAVLAVRFYVDLSERQIADVLGCRPGTVKSALHRGLAQLRKELT